MKFVESTEKGPINFASDWKNKFSDIAQKIIAISGSKSNIEFVETNDIYSDQAIADITAAKEKLGWFPVILLDEGLKQTFDYLEAQKGIRDPQAYIQVSEA